MMAGALHTCMRKCRWVSVWMVPYRRARKGWSTAPRMRSSVSTRITCLGDPHNLRMS